MVIPKEDFTQLAIGSRVNYYLRSIDLPKNPHQIWHGRVLHIDTSKNTVLVALLDKGFEGEMEFVEWKQIITIDVCASREI